MTMLRYAVKQWFCQSIEPLRVKAQIITHGMRRASSLLQFAQLPISKPGGDKPSPISTSRSRNKLTASANEYQAIKNTLGQPLFVAPRATAQLVASAARRAALASSMPSPRMHRRLRSPEVLVLHRYHATPYPIQSHELPNPHC